MIQVNNNEVLISSDDILKDMYHLFYTLTDIGINLDLIWLSFKTGDLAKRYPDKLINCNKKESIQALWINGEIIFKEEKNE